MTLSALWNGTPGPCFSCISLTFQHMYPGRAPGMSSLPDSVLSLCFQPTPALTEHRGNAMLSSPTAMGIRNFTGFPSAIHFSISPATCQGNRFAVAAFAVIHWRQPQAPGIFCASQFARLQIILNTALECNPNQAHSIPKDRIIPVALLRKGKLEGILP